MNGKSSVRERVRAIGLLCALVAGGAGILVAFNQPVEAGFFWCVGWGRHPGDCQQCPDHGSDHGEWEAGNWYWLRSPEQEKRVITGLYNRYCIRCHGVDGRGVWDIPDVPDFTNVRWQASRSDAQLARATLEGRGACMPAFRGTLTLEEAWAMARYLRSFVPGSEVPRLDKVHGEGPMLMPGKPRVLQINPSSSPEVPHRLDNFGYPVISTKP
jgi:hypothetical protein